MDTHLEWHNEAECLKRNLDPELFYPEHGTPVSREVIDACRNCLVRRQCLTYAMSAEKDKKSGRSWRHGFWGGLSAQQRTRLDTRITSRKRSLEIWT